MLVLGAAIGALFIGLAGFAANTAEWVNVVAHVEKEIAFACVDAEGDATEAHDGVVGETTIPATGVGDCNFGVVFPQTVRTMTAELALSRSFIESWDGEGAHEVLFVLLWECKLIDPTQLWNAETNQCREDLPEADPLHLDGPIRDHVAITSPTGTNCIRAAGGTNVIAGTGVQTPENAKVEFISRGFMNQNQNQLKCVYTLTLTVPFCNEHHNPNTDPRTPEGQATPLGIDCQDNVDEENPGDPQLWEFWADLGDDFKVQVRGFEGLDDGLGSDPE